MMNKNVGRFLKRSLCAFLVSVILTTSFPLTIFANSDEYSSDSEITTEATNPIGEVLQDAIEQEQEEEESGAGEASDSLFKISDVEMNGLTAQVSVVASGECTVMVAVYEESSGRFVTSGNAKADSENTDVTVQLEDCTLPEYYVVKAYIIDEENKPLCSVYENTDHTARMVEFYSKTIYDFDSEYVINMDSSATNNFAVVSESAKIIKTSNSVNTITTNDYENGRYVFENVDDSFKNVTIGDIIFVRTGDGSEDFILAKISSINMVGSKVTVDSAKVSEPDEMFSYIKIDTDNVGDVAAIDDSAEGSKDIKIPVEIEFEVDSQKESDENIKVTCGASYKVGIKFFGSITLKFEYFYDLNNDIKVCEYTTTYDVGGEGTLTVGATMSLELKGKVESVPSPYGIQVFASLSFKLEITGQLSVKFGITYTGVEGYRKEISSTRGIYKNDTIGDAPKPKVTFEEEVEAFVKITLTAKIGLQFIKVLKAYIKGEVEFNIKASKLFDLEISKDKIGMSFPFLPWTETSMPEPMKHGCSVCLVIEIETKASAGVVVEVSVDDIVNLDTMDMSAEFTVGAIEITFPPVKYRCSIYKGKFEYEEIKTDSCPHCEFLVSFLAIDPEDSNSPVKDIVITLVPEELEEDNKFYNKHAPQKTEIKTNESGVATAYLPISIYNYTVKNGDYKYLKRAGNTSIIVDEAPADAVLIMQKLRDVKIYVKDMDGKALSSINVESFGLNINDNYSGDTVVTNNSGVAAFRMVNGTYKFKATAEDGRCAETEVYVDGDTETTIVIDMGRVVTVTVTRPDGTPLEGARINLNAKTDANGQAQIILDNGTHDIYADYNGETGSATVNVDNAPANVAITLDVGYKVTFVVKDYYDILLENVSINGQVTTDARGEAVLWYNSGEHEVSLTYNSVTFTESFVVAGADRKCELIIYSYYTETSSTSWEIINRTLYLTGHGSMYYKPDVYGYAPWAKYYDEYDRVVIGEGFTSVADRAFENFSWITYVSLPSTLKHIGDGAFYGCTNLTSINLPAGLLSIGENAFSYVDFVSLTIPSSVRRIESYAFRGVSHITSLTLPDGIQYVGIGAFENCTSLTEITIPVPDDEYMYNSSFKNCTSLKKITLTKGRGIMFDSRLNLNEERLTPWYENRDTLTELVISEGVTHIGDYAFYYCYNLADVDLSNSLKSIGKYAFYNIAIKTITIPESVSYIGKGAFEGCKKLIKVNWNAIECYDFDDMGSAFNGCGSDSSFEVIFGSNVTKVPNCVFKSCGNLSKVTFLCNITSISNEAFRGCKALVSITIPESVKSIGDYAFANCTSLDTITLPKNLESIGHSAFSGCEELLNLNIPESVQSIGDYAFEYCDKLASFTIPKCLKSAGKSMFYQSFGITNIFWNAENLVLGLSEDYDFEDFLGWHYYSQGPSVSITIGPDVKFIEDCLFIDGECITSVKISEGVTGIGDYAFEDCYKLTDIQLPKSLETIGDSTFRSCTRLEQLVLPEALKTIGDNAFEYCTKLRELELPESLETIGDSAFHHCTGLESITIPYGVEKVGAGAFISCYNLTVYWNVVDYDGFNEGNNPFETETGSGVKQVVFGDSVERIPDNMFKNSRTLTSVILSPEVKAIGLYAFNNCRVLNEVILPEDGRLTTIGEYAFSACGKITEVFIPSTLRSIGTGAFSNNNIEAIYWNITSAADVVVGEGIFERSEISAYIKTKLVLSNSVNSLPRELFEKHSIYCVDFIDGTEKIPDGMFKYVSNLGTVCIPSSVKSIGNAAFYRCDMLYRINYQGSYADWQKISIGHSNDDIFDVEKATYSYTPTEFKMPIGLYEITRNYSLNTSSGVKKYADVNIINGESTVVGEYTVTIEDTTENNSYLLLVVKSDAVADILSPDNLLFVDQKVASGEALTFNFVPREEFEDYKVIVTSSFIKVADCETAGHSFGSYVPDDVLFCEIGGTEYAVCDKCGLISIREIEALGHIEYVEIEGVAATCTSDGCTAKISCERCGMVISEQKTITAGHTVEEWTVTLEPTVTTDGERVGECIVCSEVVREVISFQPVLMLGIAAEGNIRVNDMTYFKYVSPLSGSHSIVSISDIDTVGYLFDENKNQLAYNDDGEVDTDFEIVYNLVEGATYYVGVKASDITADAVVNVMVMCPHPSSYEKDAVEPTCSQEGHTKGMACTICDSWVSGEYIEKFSHTTKNWTLTTEPTCTTYGIETAFCTVCGEAAKTRNVAKSSHTYTVWTITKEATCEDTGSKYSTCDVCQNAETRIIPLAHIDMSFDGVCDKCDEQISEIVIGHPKTVEVVANEDYEIKFTAPVDGRYTFKTNVKEPCMISICDENGNKLSYTWGKTDTLSCNMEAGKVYSLVLCYETLSGKITITLSVQSPVCDHENIVRTEAVEPTCSSVGYTAGDRCVLCATFISGHVEISTTDHLDEDLDGYCEVCSLKTYQITIDQTVKFDLEWGEEVYYKCILPISGKYSFDIEADVRYKVAVCDENKSQIFSATPTSSYTLEGELSKNDVYYFYIAARDDGAFEVTLTLLEAYCDHENITRYDRVEGTCFEVGYTEGIYCNDCNVWLEGHKEIKVEHEDFDEDGICEKCNQNASDILPGETKTVNATIYETVHLKFIPEVSGVYTLSSQSCCDTYAQLYNSDWEELAFSYGESDPNFSITYELTAGEIYYYRVGYLFYTACTGYDVTLIFNCEHKNTTEYEMSDATCAQPGYTAGVYCNDCSQWIEGHEIFTIEHTYDNSCDAECNVCTETREITHDWSSATCTTPAVCKVCGVTDGIALGHFFKAVVTPPTCTEDGFTTYTCNCGESYTSDEVKALGHSFKGGYCENCGEADTKVYPGDLTGDTVVNLSDLFLLKSYLGGYIELTEAQTQAADINGDGKINLSDFYLIKRYLATGEF